MIFNERINQHKGVSFVEEDKENAGANTQIPESPDMRKSSIGSFRSAELSRLRTSLQSPQRKDLVKQTQMAINSATVSVLESLNNKKSQRQPGQSINPSLNAARKAKDENLKKVSNRTKSVRFQWEKETAASQTLYKRVEDNRRQIMAVQRKITSAHFKEQSKIDKKKKQNKYTKLEEEYTFNSETYQEQQRILKEEMDRNRKMSIEARAKLRQNHREGEEKLKRQREREDAAIHEIRNDLHMSRREAARKNAEARRMSFQFRAGDARRIRAIRSTWQEEEAQKEHESYELSRGAAKDAEAYKKKMVDKRRESHRFRNIEARHWREKQAIQHEESMAAEHESILLNMDGERDAAAYRKKMQEERRKSLAGRNAESFRHAKAMQELRSIVQEQEAESFVLKWAGEEDAKNNLVKMAEERRKSLQFRGQEARRIRQFEEDQHFKEVQAAIAEGHLQSECK